MYTYMNIYTCIYRCMHKRIGEPPEHHTAKYTHTTLTKLVLVEKGLCACTLQYTAIHCNMLQHTAACCSVLQCIAVYCSVLQCITGCCRVLQGVAVCCVLVEGALQ